MGVGSLEYAIPDTLLMSLLGRITASFMVCTKSFPKATVARHASTVAGRAV